MLQLESFQSDLNSSSLSSASWHKTFFNLSRLKLPKKSLNTFQTRLRQKSRKMSFLGDSFQDYGQDEIKWRMLMSNLLMSLSERCDGSNSAAKCVCSHWYISDPRARTSVSRSVVLAAWGHWNELPDVGVVPSPLESWTLRQYLTLRFWLTTDN